MNIIAANASAAATTAGDTISSASSSIGNTISSNVTYVKDSTYALGIETELSIVNLIGNLIDPQDFADRELQEDLNNNRILMVQSYGGSRGCKSVSQPYLAPAGPDYNAILNNKYAQSVLGSQTVANIPPDSVPVEPVVSTGTDKPMNNSEVALLEIEQASSAVNYTVNAIYENPFVQFIIQNLRVIEFPFIYWRWFVKKIGIMWCNLIYTVSSSFYKEKYSHPTDYEKRMVIANMNSLLSFLFSVLITYNWFFLMYYEFNGEKIITFDFSVASLKNFSGIINFIFQYVAYPLECMDWLMLHFLPKWTLRFFRTNMNFVFIITYAFFSFVTLTSVGPAVIDLFYDSLKLFFNSTLKPWQPALVHSYTSFWKSFYNFGDTSTTTVKYSVTLSTYVFLHIMIFYAQIPDLIPSFFYAKTVGNAAVGATQDVYESLTSKSGKGNGNPNASKFGINPTDALNAASGLTSSAAGIATGIADVVPHKNDQGTGTTQPQDQQKRQQRGMSKRKGGNYSTGGLGGLGSVGSFASKLNPLSYMPKFPGLGSLSSIGSALSSPFAGTILGAIGNVIVAIVRFCLSQYLVNISAFLVATYLLWYSFFGIFWFSKLSLFGTMKEIDIFILKHSMDYVYETCVSTECKNRTIWERIKEIFINISRFSFPLIFYVTIFFILINSCFEYTNATSGMKSSPYIKYGMTTSSIIAIVLLAIKGYVSFIHNKI